MTPTRKLELKRLITPLLSVLLAFALTLSFALPALAINWDDFRITKQPQGLTVLDGDSFTLSVEVQFPAGAVVEYQWYVDGSYYSGSTINATGPSLTAAPGDLYYALESGRAPDNHSYKNYYCKITGYEMDGDEIFSERTLQSDTVTVWVTGQPLTFWEKMFVIFVLPIFETAGFVMIGGGFLAIPFLLVSPFVYLGTVIWRAVLLAIS